MGNFSTGFRVAAGSNKKPGGCFAMIFGLLFACGGFVFLVVMGKMWFKEAKCRFQNPRTRIPSSWMSVIATTLMG
jgi:hypothetical protein